MEFLQYTYGGGTKKEHFITYFQNLVAHLKAKYPRKLLVIIMDNLWYDVTFPFNFFRAHKCSDIMKIGSDKNVVILYTPSNSPQ